MNIIIKELLNRIEEEEQKFGDSIFTQNGKVNEEEIVFFNNWISKIFMEGFAEYIDFVNLINGLNFNGLYLYSLNRICEYNIFESNDTWWENEELKEYIFFGDDNISWYCLNRNNGGYFVLDKPSGEIMEKYESFTEIIIKALKIAIGEEIK